MAEQGEARAAEQITRPIERRNTETVRPEDESPTRTSYSLRQNKTNKQTGSSECAAARELPLDKTRSRNTQEKTPKLIARYRVFTWRHKPVRLRSINPHLTREGDSSHTSKHRKINDVTDTRTLRHSSHFKGLTSIWRHSWRSITVINRVKKQLPVPEFSFYGFLEERSYQHSLEREMK